MSLLGFKNKYARLRDRIRYVDYSTQELQSSLTPARVIEIMKEGNKRFHEGRPLFRDHRRQVRETSHGQHPMGVILSCIDSRAPVEMIFDVGLGDFFSIRMAANVVGTKELACMEYSCAFAGAKLILVLGHSSCGAVGAAVDFFQKKETAKKTAGCEYLDEILHEIQKLIDPKTGPMEEFSSELKRKSYVNDLAERNVLNAVELIRKKSSIIDGLVSEGKVNIVGAFYNVATGKVKFLK